MLLCFTGTCKTRKLSACNFKLFLLFLAEMSVGFAIIWGRKSLICVTNSHYIVHVTILLCVAQTKAKMDYY